MYTYLTKATIMALPKKGAYVFLAKHLKLISLLKLATLQAKFDEKFCYGWKNLIFWFYR